MKRERIQKPRPRRRREEPALAPRPSIPDRRDLKERIDQVRSALDAALDLVIQ